MLLMAGWCDQKFVLMVMDANGQEIFHRISLTRDEWERCRDRYDAGDWNGVNELINADHKQIG